ncbi:solute carrier organic anion transporter family member 1C1-like [Oenanthe melanoleuca]|uniref:solute carrier organic anion transporter family member 1C1-like n=1 Tax=Oenanthe melanoleuca TaxID=2939378 RepID=UPI0024C16BEA|nr:solute carrier organic anion transporter family member 1C1-like [Oenanthe melanoleuca]XP_056349793.1 solute carrier organic anion transporter family member 1C1-like [Oenanthe melanoleuca]XP_056349794.1 solute carrier organic anion transporter family member 1C1-like [Oenanthe melanoleuca]XP_056349796.1 solute carrier organic anion transporter family member 1C1-like [Oenanthe melanoleuca]XP_056349797.1 solute carrier organic anion transporter family member 1C1-like [Oenanthe melanoleuca]
MTVETKPSNVSDSNQEADPDQLSDDEGNKNPPAKKTSSCTGLKVFLAALSFSYFSKALCGTIMKSSITQIERRFGLTSSTAGFVDGSFEMGNLLVIAFVSYFGAKLHRPRVIAVGCFTMALGCFLSAMPHFFMGYYKYETTSRTAASANFTSSINPCSLHQDVNGTVLEVSQSGCEKEPSSYMWIYILLGNMLRGIGETPITPLGISYLDDFAKEENVPVYVACLHTIAMMGPMFGFLLGSLCAKLYVDIGFVDPGSITITPQDSRWVGAWWLGFLIGGATSLLSAIPFCFLPRSLEKPEGARKDKTSHGLLESTGAVRNKLSPGKTKPRKWSLMLKDFCNSLKKVLGNRMYFTFLCCSLLQFSGFIGFLTYKPKYMEQQYGQSTSKSNFLIGMTSLPPVGLGIFLGGLIMKKYKMGIIGATKFSFIMSFLSYAISLLHFFVGCDNYVVAGMTVSYEGNPIPYHNNSLFSACNSGCQCASNTWDPVCGANGITYVSACLAGCATSTGHGKSTVFHNCKCLEIKSSWSGNTSATLGQCPKSDDCSLKFIYYTVIQVIGGFCYALGATPSYMLIFRCVHPELKALAVGLYTLALRMLAGIPAPVYFGAAIDRTCLKWGSSSCGRHGACRLYDSNAHRYVFLGLGAILRGPSYLVGIIFYTLIKKHFQNKNSRPLENGQEDAAMNKEENCKIKERLPGSSDAENESSI